MTRNLNENSLTEQPVIDWLKELGYDYEYGPDISPGGDFPERDDFTQVVLKKRLFRSLKRLNPGLDQDNFEDVFDRLKKLEHPNIANANKEMYKLITEGVKVKTKSKREDKWLKAKLIDFENPMNNEFLVVNQFAIQGIEGVRRPDVIIFVNGLPLAIFELKSPTREEGTIKSAYNQLMDTYKKELPDLFKYNQVLVTSDLFEAKHGTLTSPWEWFSVWKGVKDENENHKTERQLKVLIRGIFHKVRFIDIINNFIVFETEEDKVEKKMCLYHQYYGVNKAVEETLRATASNGDKKIGVFWHTQGSGKSLSMVFYVNKTRRIEKLRNPTYVFLTDRNDLDNQLYKTFLRSGYPHAKQAETIKDLRDKLRTPAGDLIFTTIQKFASDDKDKYPLLSERKNMIVIADEAHRSHYAKLAGNVRFAIPNASFMGITGTPISLDNRDTRLVFGNYISTYQVDQAVEDGATVPIYYEGRLVPLHLTNKFIDEEYEDLMAEQEFEVKESLKRKWSRLEQAIGAKDRLEQVAKDIVNHFTNRGLEGKAMVVTMSRRIAAEMYKLISEKEESPKAAVVMSNIEEYKEQVQEETDVKEIERKFKDPEDPLKIVVVCDMWLTGFDVPPLHTMYIDKPLKNHTLMQAIARVNRIFKDKKGGLIVDYIGIADNLKKSLSIYSSDIQKDALVPIEEAINKMLEKYDIVKSFFSGINYSNWQKIKGAELADLFQSAVNAVLTNEKTGVLDEDRKKSFLREATHLFRLFALVSPHKEANRIRSDVKFFKSVKRTIIKRTTSKTREVSEDVETTVKELISQSFKAEGVIDIFDMTKKGKPDISIFDDNFLKEVKKMQYKNLAIQVLRRLLKDEVRIRMKKNEIRYKSFLEILEDLIEKYENNIIDSTRVIERLIELADEIKEAEEKGKDLGLTEEELAFYDAVSQGKSFIKNDEELKAFVKEIVSTIRRDLTVDWTNNKVIKARIRANVRRMLLSKGATPEESENLLSKIFRQAELLYRDFIPSTV